MYIKPPLERIEEQARRLLLEGIALFDPRYGGTAFENFGRDGRVHLRPVMGAEIEFLAWPRANAFFADGKNPLRSEGFLSRIFEDGAACGGPNEKQKAKRILTAQAPHRFARSRYLSRIGRAYRDAAVTCGEITLRHDHPDTMGSPLALALTLPRFVRGIADAASDYDLAYVDFRAFPQPAPELIDHVTQTYGVERQEYLYGMPALDFRNVSVTNQFIACNSLQVSLSLAPMLKDVSIAKKPMRYRIGDRCYITGRDAMDFRMYKGLVAMDENYLGIGFDMTEPHRHDWLNLPPSIFRMQGKPVRIKRAGRIENGWLSPTGIAAVSVLCSLAGAYAALKDNLVMDGNGDIDVASYPTEEFIVGPDYPAGAAIFLEGDVHYRRAGSSPYLERVFLERDYPAMIEKAAQAGTLRSVMNTLSRGDLGTRIHDVLLHRAGRILDAIENKSWPYLALPQPAMMPSINL
ncbi:MAG: hypothetical protein H6865_04875 [Rhodospirillales bacterium]|nr:hypothetical protein [Alphaproteobacteria bacterium]MCB9986951.1 hypothetical protein [Rhodospirillales bacterium]USO08274.1 MAG: hypothetical protein H6866_03415 [Rhodospirillales bacterium]